MRVPMLLAVLLGSNLVMGTACRQRNIGPNSLATSLAEDEATPDTEAVVLPDDEAPPEVAEQLNDSMDLDLVEGDLPDAAVVLPHPLESLSSQEIENLVLHQPEKLGPASLGRPNSGALYGGLVMPTGEQWKLVNARETWGTQETVDYLSHTISEVNKRHPGTPIINIGDISGKNGGHLNPHHSHQSGRDVDIGFYYKDQSRWYATANASNLDMARTWEFIKVTIIETDIEAIFIDRQLKKLFRAYAETQGEPTAWLDAVFGGPSSHLRPVLLHEPGHKTHMHLRYYNPIAQETGRRVYKALLKHKKIKPPTYFLKYKVKRGDTLNKIARKKKTTVAAIKKANRLRGNRIYANRTYKIPRKGGVIQPRKLVLPARRLPAKFLAKPHAAGSSTKNSAVK